MRWCGSMAEQLICNQQVDGSTPFTSSSSMGEFPSGQRGQTVNLLSLTSLVRIQLPPPYKNTDLTRSVFLYLGRSSTFGKVCEAHLVRISACGYLRRRRIPSFPENRSVDRCFLYCEGAPLSARCAKRTWFTYPLADIFAAGEYPASR